MMACQARAERQGRAVCLVNQVGSPIRDHQVMMDCQDPRVQLDFLARTVFLVFLASLAYLAEDFLDCQEQRELQASLEKMELMAPTDSQDSQEWSDFQDRRANEVTTDVLAEWASMAGLDCRD